MAIPAKITADAISSTKTSSHHSVFTRDTESTPGASAKFPANNHALPGILRAIQLGSDTYR